MSTTTADSSTDLSGLSTDINDTSTLASTTEDSSSSSSSNSSSNSSTSEDTSNSDSNTTYGATMSDTGDESGTHLTRVTVGGWKNTVSDNPPSQLTSDDVPTLSIEAEANNDTETPAVPKGLTTQQQNSLDYEVSQWRQRGIPRPPKRNGCMDRLRPYHSRPLCGSNKKRFGACCVSQIDKNSPYVGIEFRPSPWFCVILGMILGGTIVILAGYLAIIRPLRDFEADLRPTTCTHLAHEYDETGSDQYIPYVKVRYDAGAFRNLESDAYLDSRAILFDNWMSEGDRNEFFRKRPLNGTDITSTCYYNINARDSVVFLPKAAAPYAATAMYMMGITYLVLVLCFGVVPLFFCMDDDDPWFGYRYGQEPIDKYLKSRALEHKWGVPAPWKPRHQSEHTSDLMMCGGCYCGGLYCSDCRMMTANVVKTSCWILVILLCAGACFAWSLLFFHSRYYNRSHRQATAGQN